MLTDAIRALMDNAAFDKWAGGRELRVRDVILIEGEGRCLVTSNNLVSGKVPYRLLFPDGTVGVHEYYADPDSCRLIPSESDMLDFLEARGLSYGMVFDEGRRNIRLWPIEADTPDIIDGDTRLDALALCCLAVGGGGEE